MDGAAQLVKTVGESIQVPSMKTRILLLAALAALTVSAFAEDWMSVSKYYARTFAEQYATAKEKVESQSAWLQCEGTLKGFEEAVGKLPEADRAPFLAKIKEAKPDVVAGASRNRAFIIARHLSDNLEDAKGELAAGRIPADFYFEKLDRDFAEPDLKSLPADQFKKLHAEYADLKKRSSK
jgi:hypothetical protein